MLGRLLRLLSRWNCANLKARQKSGLTPIVAGRWLVLAEFDGEFSNATAICAAGIGGIPQI
jgi:hypothetical protein